MGIESIDMSWQIINQAWTKAESIDAQLQERMDAAQTATSWSGGELVPQVVDPIASIPAPEVDIPLEAQGPDMTLFNQYNDNIIDKLVDLFSNFIADNYPTSMSMYAEAESWVKNQLQNGGSGINAAIEAQLHERERSRALADAQRAENEITESWAAKRFPMPPGALAYQILQVQQKAQDEIAKSSREVAIKSWEAELDMIKLAVVEAEKMRSAAVGAAGDYIKTMASSQNTSYQLTMGKSQAQNGLIAAAASWYNAETNAKDTIFKSNLAKASLTQDAGKVNATLKVQNKAKVADVAVANAEFVARQAQAMLNNLHTSVGVQGQQRIGA